MCRRAKILICRKIEREKLAGRQKERRTELTITTWAKAEREKKDSDKEKERVGHMQGTGSPLYFIKSQ
jgi:hypothetical protein